MTDAAELEKQASLLTLQAQKLKRGRKHILANLKLSEANDLRAKAKEMRNG